MNHSPDRIPRRTRVYENHHLDSPRWDRFETRPDDIIITTAYKSGTTWTQTIVANLIFQDGDIPGDIMDMSPWVDMRMRPFENIQAVTAAQAHRRFLKTHLPLDGLPWKPELKYIYVGRDLRDVFMSIWNHYSKHTPTAFEAINNPDTLVGDPFPACPADIREFWQSWVERSWFEWERDGYPYWSATHHVASWWAYRHLENILFVHYADLLREPEAEIARIAAFLDIEVSPDTLLRIVDRTSFASMRAHSDRIVGRAAAFWENGGKTFLNKGTNGRWREVLTEDDLEAYRAMLARAVPPDCQVWLERGRAALPGD